MEYLLEILTYELFTIGIYAFTVLDVLKITGIYVLVLLSSTLLRRFLTRKIAVVKNMGREERRSFTRMLSYALHLLGLWFALYSIGIHPNTSLLKINDNITLRVSNLIQIGLIYFVARLFIFLMEKVFAHKLIFNITEEGKRFAVIQISRYIVVTLAIVIGLSSIGVNLGLLWGGLAALLVGLGFGIQQTFNDLVSGLILLIEGTVKVGDIIEIESVAIGKVISIGIRVSTVETRDGINIIVPNSKFVVDNVINWSGSASATRFTVSVGVAYGSDTLLVKEKLLEITENQEFVVHHPETPIVLFKNFGDSALEFELYFWTYEIWDIEIIKSKMRFDIDAIFRKNNITIAFPQRDIHFKIDAPTLSQIKEEFKKL